MNSLLLRGIGFLLSSLGGIANGTAEEPIATLVVLSNPYITTLKKDIKDELGRDRSGLARVLGPSMKKSVGLIGQIKPDAVVILGSLTWTGSDADFDAFEKSIEGISAPVFLTPGLMDTPDGKFGGYLKRFEKRNAAQSLKKVNGVHLLFAHDIAQSRPLRKAMERMKRQLSEAGPAKATLLFGGRAHHRSWGELNPQNDEFWKMIEEHRIAGRFQPLRYDSRVKFVRTLPVFVVGSTGWSLRGAVTVVRIYNDRVRVEIVSDPTQPTFAMDVPNPVSAPRMKTAEADPFGSPSYSADLAGKPDFTFAAVSDPQLSVGKNRDSLLGTAAKNIEELNHLSPKMVFVTGDLVEDNLPAEYALFNETFSKLIPPRHLMPGNHDVLYCHKYVEQLYTDADKRKPEAAKVSRAAAKAVEKEGFAGPTCLYEKFLGIKPRQTIVHGDSAFICMRILTQNVEASELQWLREQLDKTKEAKHVFVLGHYPVLPAFGNNVQPAAGGDEVLKLLKDYKVAAFIFGHRHRNGFRMHDGTAHVLTDNMRSIHLFHVFEDRIVLGRKSVGAPLYEKITLPEPRAGGWDGPPLPVAKKVEPVGPQQKPAGNAPAVKAEAKAPAVNEPDLMKERGIVFYLPFEGDLVARTPATEVEPTAGIILTEDMSQSVTIGELQKGKHTKVGGEAIIDTGDGRFSYVPGVHRRAVHLKQMLTYPAPWMKGMAEGTIVVWYRNPVWRMLTWRVPAMLTTAQTYRAKPAAFQTPLSHWIFDRLTSPPEQGDSKWKHWTIVNNEYPRNLRPRIEPDNQWHSWVLRWKRDGHVLEVLDDDRLRDISKYENRLPPGKDHWEDYYLGRKSIVYEDVGHIKLDEILLGEIHLARYAYVELDEICVWNRALSNDDLTKAYERGRAGQTSFQEPLLPKPKRRLTDGLDLAAHSQERPALPKQVEWGNEGAVIEETETRHSVCLNGYWRLQPTDGRFVPPTPDGWGYARLPGWVADEPRVRAQRVYDGSFRWLKKKTWNGRPIGEHDMFWYERDVDVPQSHEGRRFFLRFERVDGALPFVDVYVNGRYVRRLRTYGPGHLDVTNWIDAGKSNRITLGVEGKVRLLFDWYLDARTLNSVSAHDLYIISEWRKKSVTVRADLENHTAAEQTFAYSADLFEWESGKKVHSIPGRSIKLAAGAKQTVEIRGEWRNPREWSIYDPFLHTAQLVIRDAKGAVADRSLKVRFGYREIWSERGWLHCNGSKLQNRGIGQGCGIMGYHVPVSYADMFNHSMAFMAYHKSVNTFWKRSINVHGADAIHDAGDRTGFFTSFRLSGTGFTADRLWSGNREGQLRDRAYARWLRNHPSLGSYIIRQSGNYDQKEGIGGGGAETRNWREKFNEDASWIPYKRAWDQFAAPTKQEHPSALFMGLWLPYGDQIGTRLGKHGYGFPLQSREEEPRFYAYKGMAHLNAEMGWPQISRNGFDASGMDDLKKHYRKYWPNLTQFNEAYSAMYLGDEAYEQESEVKDGLSVHYAVADGDVALFSWNYVKGVETVGRPFTRRTRFHSSPALFKIRKLFTRRMIQAWRWYGYGYWEHTETSHYLKTAPPHAVSDETAEVHTEDYPGLRGPGLFVDDGKRPSIQKVCEDPAKLRKTVTHSKIGGLVIKAQAPLVAWIYGHPDIASKDHSWYAGETIRKQIGVISEHPYPVEATVKWWVKQTNGKQIAEGETLASFERGDQQLHPIVFKSPIVTEKSRYVIEIETSVEGKVVHEDQFPFQVFPPHKTAGITGNIGLIDSQATGAMLRIAGVSYTPVTETSDLSKLDLLVIGRQCRQAEVRELLKKLDINKHLAAGLNVLVFEQNGQVLERPTPDPWPRLTLNDRPDRPELASFGLRIEHTSSRYTFIRNPEHPIFKGLSNEDIANWRGASNHLPPWTRLEWMGNTRTGTRNWRESQASNMGEIATFVFDKPHGGNFVSLADASFDTLYSALLEERRAKGRTICCQLNVTNRYLADPTATLIVDRLLAYAVKRADGPMDKATFLGGNQWSPTIERLPFDLQPIGNKRLEGFDILVVGIGTPHIDTYNENNELIGTTAAPADEKDVSLTWLRNNREAVAEFVKSGGTVLTLPVAAESDLSWPPFKVSLKNEKVFAVKQNNFFKTCRAIGPADLYWHRALELPVFASLPEGSTTTTPAILARVPYGKGEFIFTQIHPKSVYGNWPESKITRLLSALLTEKGIADQHDLDLTIHGYQKGGFPYFGTTLYFDPFLSTAW